ncbi:hypothetical protein [Helicobacter canis]|uniref:hypothetical protein n=1 Tax=Helicobacter canis TaxID=29419 RepID=UPI0015F0E73F|nr:hypothetical protein [Helicobacter canis]
MKKLILAITPFLRHCELWRKTKRGNPKQATAVQGEAAAGFFRKQAKRSFSRNP